METFSRVHVVESEQFRRVQAGSGVREYSRNISSSQRLSEAPGRYLSQDAASRLIAAVQYGSRHHETWRGITINFSLLDAPQSAEQTMRALMDHVRHWQERNHVPPYWCWVREQGAQLGDHAHILAAAPAGSGRALSINLGRWLRGPSIRGDFPRNTLHTRPTTPTGWLEYATKTVEPSDARALNERFGVRIATEKPGGVVIGQRIGIARQLGPKARSNPR